jgi:hypothetical protein
MGTIRLVAAFSLAFLLIAVATLDSAAPLKMEVSPAVSRAPAVVTVRVMVNATAEDRTLHVAAESATFYRSSEVDLDGAGSGPVHFEFRDLPSGLYQITGVLVDAHGPRATVSRLAKVEPGVGSR